MQKLLIPVIALCVPLISSATTVFTSAVMNGLPVNSLNASNPLPGLSGVLTFSESTPNQTVVPNTAFNVGTIPETLTSPGPTTDPGGNGESSPIDTAITLDLTYNINGTAYTGTLNGTFVQDGWTKSITSGQYFANDLIYFAGDTLSGGLDSASLGNSGYKIETSATSLASGIAVGKGQAVNVTLVNSAPEPATWGIMGLGLIGMAFAMRRRAVRAKVKA